MIASTLLTSGVENCNVVAGSPIEVSGTGALTGIMMAYEASGKNFPKTSQTATEELVTTGDLAKDLGQDTASDLINDVKESVIEDKLTDPSDIQDAISDAADKQGITLTDDQFAKITSLMESISQYDYDVKALKRLSTTWTGNPEDSSATCGPPSKASLAEIVLAVELLTIRMMQHSEMMQSSTAH